MSRPLLSADALLNILSQIEEALKAAKLAEQTLGRIVGAKVAPVLHQEGLVAGRDALERASEDLSFAHDEVGEVLNELYPEPAEDELIAEVFPEEAQRE